MTKPSQANLVTNERAKVAAAFCNSLAAAFAAGGVFGPILAIMRGADTPSATFWAAFAGSWLLFAWANRRIARRHLGRKWR